MRRGRVGVGVGGVIVCVELDVVCGNISGWYLMLVGRIICWWSLVGWIFWSKWGRRRVRYVVVFGN